MGSFTDRTGEISYNNQGEKMTIIAYRKAIDIDIQFEDGIIIYNKSYANFKNGKIKHPIRYSESFAYYIEVELGINLDDIWNWDKNNENKINPYEIYKCGTEKVWLYCLEKDYHNYDREGNKIGYEIMCSKFYNNQRCGYCHKGGGRSRVHWKDSLAYNYPQVVKMIAIKENNLTFEDCYNIACKSDRKFYFKCLDCGMVSKKQTLLRHIVNGNSSCKYCSDGISIPNKFMTNTLKQLSIEFTTELNKSDFNWCGYFRYDFYLPKYNMIIEMNGGQHYEECTLTKRSLFEEQMNDLFKYKCAKNHVDNYIVIDCRYSTLEWMKENIIKELSSYLNLNNVNWELAWEESQRSIVVTCLELYKEGWSIDNISKKINISNSTIYRWIRDMNFLE